MVVLLFYVYTKHIRDIQCVQEICKYPPKSLPTLNCCTVVSLLPIGFHSLFPLSVPSKYSYSVDEAVF